VSLDIIPVPEEQEWLGNALRDLFDRGGRYPFLCSPVLRPSPEHFLDPWSGTLADVHRLTQRLMHQAGLGKLAFTLSGFDERDDAWDSGTAGWFAGIEDGRCLFGVHLKQLKDPEAAIGVMAHEVAHAWREHHDLVVEDRDVEEVLTDLTTIVLGFGVFTTNNTDRYRSYGISRATYWSVSSTGYLPPPAMAWLLALQAFARGGGEARAVGDDLEPNQQASFRAALYELGRDPSPFDALRLQQPPPSPHPYELIAVYEPSMRDIHEPANDQPDVQRNAGVRVHRLIKTGPGSLLIGLYLGAVAGLVIAWLFFGFDDRRETFLCVAGGAAIGMIVLRLKKPLVCSDRECGTTVTRDMAVCPGCGGTLGDVVSELQLSRLREEELERDSATIPFEECDECEPEYPCEKHA
jgi:hypothetical protein